MLQNKHCVQLLDFFSSKREMFLSGDLKRRNGIFGAYIHNIIVKILRVTTELQITRRYLSRITIAFLRDANIFDPNCEFSVFQNSDSLLPYSRLGPGRVNTAVRHRGALITRRNNKTSSISALIASSRVHT